MNNDMVKGQTDLNGVREKIAVRNTHTAFCLSFK